MPVHQTPVLVQFTLFFSNIVPRTLLCALSERRMEVICNFVKDIGLDVRLGFGVNLNYSDRPVSEREAFHTAIHAFSVHMKQIVISFMFSSCYVIAGRTAKEKFSLSVTRWRKERRESCSEKLMRHSYILNGLLRNDLDRSFDLQGIG